MLDQTQLIRILFRTNSRTRIVPSSNSRTRTVPSSNSRTRTVPSSNSRKRTLPGSNRRIRTVPRSNSRTRTIPSSKTPFISDHVLLTEEIFRFFIKGLGVLKLSISAVWYFLTRLNLFITILEK